ncbi:NDRG4 protein (S33 family) [Fasciolopsis buskii]|uniref:NDRG4 protein (S33 family) n=1 Tax=Fasciolopsis buskii TaxID=27845 RepID=A0A8E0VFN2_9TREM|nr:NDRG4 protein (S33 family) [Fasciolopsis buski]
MTDNLLEQLDNHWFGYRLVAYQLFFPVLAPSHYTQGLAENEDIVLFYHALAKSLNPTNLAGYIHSFMERTPINLVRPLGPPMPGSAPSTQNTNGVTNTTEPTVIETEVCLVTGDRATDLSRVLAEMNGQMDPKHTQFLMIPDCTGMVMEENPDKLAVDFLHFLRSIGLLINLTPEKLHQQAATLYEHLPEFESALAVENVPARLTLESDS